MTEIAVPPAAGVSPAVLAGSAPEIGALRCALQAALCCSSAPADLREEEARRALRVFGAELRRRELHAEHLVIALKQVWASLPEAQRLSHGLRAAQRERLVTLGIEEFYGDATAAGASRQRSQGAGPT